ncbi:hypothetical protein ES707_07073 [subsurface metagenome]
MKSTPNYIKTLLLPSTKAPQGRRAWSIDLETVWLPFLTATNTMGDTAIPHDALGAPLRLAMDKDGSVRFGRNGRPVTRIAKPIAQTVTLVRENFVANLKDYASQVAETHADAFNEQIVLQREAGTPIIDNDKVVMDKAIQLQIEQTVAEAERKRQAEAEAVAETPEPEPELVPA